MWVYEMFEGDKYRSYEYDESIKDIMNIQYEMYEYISSSMRFVVQRKYLYSPQISIFLDNDEIDAVKLDSFDEDVKNTLALAEASMSFDVGLYYAPLYGKFSVFGWILNYDVHLFGGFGALFMDSVCAAGGSVCKDAINKNLEGPKFAGAVGIGLRLFFNNFVALNVDFKDYMTKYADFSRGPADDRARFQQYMVATFGVSLFFPVNVYMSR